MDRPCSLAYMSPQSDEIRTRVSAVEIWDLRCIAPDRVGDLDAPTGLWETVETLGSSANSKWLSNCAEPCKLAATVEKTAELPNQHFWIRMLHVKWPQMNGRTDGCDLDTVTLLSVQLAELSYMQQRLHWVLAETIATPETELEFWGENHGLNFGAVHELLEKVPKRSNLKCYCNHRKLNCPGNQQVYQPSASNGSRGASMSVSPSCSKDAAGD